MPNTFKGFKQVTKEYFDSIPEAEKVGYLWFVRSIVESGGTEDYSGDIFLGTRHYGHFGGEVEDLEHRLNAILYNAGIVPILPLSSSAASAAVPYFLPLNRR